MTQSLLISILLVFFSHLSIAQKQSTITVFGGKTFMGTGDLRGFNLGFGYQHLFSKHIGFETNVRATSASMNHEISYSGTQNQLNGFNTSLRVNTSGYQIELLALTPIINKTIRMHLFAGPVFRRQYNNKPNVYSYNYVPDFNITNLNLRYDNSPVTNTLGFSAQLELSLKLKEKNYLGVRIAGHSYPDNINWYFPVLYQRKL